MHQNKNQNNNKEADSKTPAKHSPHHHINNLAMDSHDSIIHLHRTIGNQVVQEPMHSNIGFDLAKIGIQPELRASQPDDVYEQEADRLAEQVMSLFVPNSITSKVPNKEDRKCAACEMKIEKMRKRWKLVEGYIMVRILKYQMKQ